MIQMDTVAACAHRFVYDEETGELVCSRGCGWAVAAFEHRELAFPPRGRKLSSPSVKDSNLGTDQNAVIADLRRGVWDPETGRRRHLLSGGLRFLPRGSNHDEDLMVELSNRLHGKVSDANQAAIAAIYRKVLRRLENERREKAVEALDQITGRSSSH